MAYIKPETVLSPKASVGELKILHNQSDGGWSVSSLLWRGNPRLAIRWNGSDKEEGCGMPNAYGRPTWFIIPEALADAILAALPKKTELELAYAAMASDEAREAEALDFCNALIGDSNAAG